MARLFDRDVAVTVNTTRFTALDAVFSIHKSLQPEPNTCQLTVFGLNPQHQAELEAIAPKGTAPASRGIPCEIEAGYKGNRTLLWRGDLRTVETTDNGPEVITSLTSGDGEKAWTHARHHVPYGPKTPIETALRAIARALSVGEGNLSKVVSRLKVGGSAVWPAGKVLSGSASRQLVSIARSADLEVSIQDGALQFLNRGKALAGQAVLLNEGTGLIGSPTVDNEGIAEFKTLLIPDMRPGNLVALDAKRVKGTYRILEIDWVGDTSANEWGATCKAESV